MTQVTGQGEGQVHLTRLSQEPTVYGLDLGGRSGSPKSLKCHSTLKQCTSAEFIKLHITATKTYRGNSVQHPNNSCPLVSLYNSWDAKRCHDYSQRLG